MANVHFIRRILYKLKQNYGFPLDLYKKLDSSDNLETGVRTSRRVRYSVKKAIILKADELHRQFKHDMRFIASHQRFSIGGFYDTQSLYVLIDRRDLPKGYEIKLDDYAIREHRHYTFDKAELLEHKLAFWIEMREVKGDIPSEIFKEEVISTLTLEQDVSHAD